MPVWNYKIIRDLQVLELSLKSQSKLLKPKTLFELLDPMPHIPQAILSTRVVGFKDNKVAPKAQTNGAKRTVEEDC